MLNKARGIAKIAGYCVPFILVIISPLLITGIESRSKLNAAYEAGNWILLCMSIFFFIAVICRWQ
jgi:NADH:ubiquinone oxidoreductase subunit H